jgi:hypothetical protein
MGLDSHLYPICITCIFFAVKNNISNETYLFLKTGTKLLFKCYLNSKGRKLFRLFIIEEPSRAPKNTKKILKLNIIEIHKER